MKRKQKDYDLKLSEKSIDIYVNNLIRIGDSYLIDANNGQKNQQRRLMEKVDICNKLIALLPEYVIKDIESNCKKIEYNDITINEIYKRIGCEKPRIRDAVSIIIPKAGLGFLYGKPISITPGWHTTGIDPFNPDENYGSRHIHGARHNL